MENHALASATGGIMWKIIVQARKRCTTHPGQRIRLSEKAASVATTTQSTVLTSPTMIELR